MPRRKKFKYTFDIVQALIFPILLLLTAGIFVSQGWVSPEDVEVVWTVIIIQLIASIGAILAAAKMVD